MDAASVVHSVAHQREAAKLIGTVAVPDGNGAIGIATYHPEPLMRHELLELPLATEAEAKELAMVDHQARLLSLECVSCETSATQGAKQALCIALRARGRSLHDVPRECGFAALSCALTAGSRHGACVKDRVS